MTTRSDIIDDFLRRSGWPRAKRSMLAGDASFRKYERVFLNDKQAVLMDAPPEKEDIRPFMHIGTHLLQNGLSAPAIYASDIQNGLLLLEDLGDELFTRHLQKEPQKEKTLYVAAADVLAKLYHQAVKADYSTFPRYDEPLLLKETSLFSQWFLPAVMEERESSASAREYDALWQKLIKHIPLLRPVLVLRDYHADNLLWLPERSALKQVGLLDFQDGVIGSPAYDMVSFLEDARRDVAPGTVQDVIDYYLQKTGIAPDDFKAAYALLGAQRNCKIVGIFMRLAVREGKQQYLSYLPRVWAHIAQDLKHPLLKPLADWMAKTIPPQWRGVITPRPITIPASA